MAKKTSTKRALLLSALALLMCVAMLVGSTFAWFTDSVTSGSNKIQSGTLKIDLELLDKQNGWASIKDSKAPIFHYDKWEPGYTDVKILKVENEGNLALKWMAKFISSAKLSELADVIDVYVCPSATELTYPADRNLNGYTKVGTVAQFVNTIEETTKGTLTAKGTEGSVAYLGIALKMQETAGNEYQNMDLGTFDIQIVATQHTYESDSFNDQYDAEAILDYAPVSNANELKVALANKEPNILLTKNIVTEEPYEVTYSATINGGGNTISRADGFTGKIFAVKANASLTLEDSVVDGGAVWTNTASSSATNNGVVATGELIAAEANAKIILNEGAVLQNNDGALAVNLGTRIGATLTMNGGWIINNRSNSGAVWGGGHITINEGSKINNNSSTGIAGAIRMVSDCNLTMNGGEICYNKATTDGGAIWGYGSSVYTLNGGEIAHNEAGGVGGGIYFGTYSKIYVNDSIEIHNNTAPNSGAFRLTNYNDFNMTGGKIYDNTSLDNANYDCSYAWTAIVKITGGELADDITIDGSHTPTVGGTGITGVVHFTIGTNHNTINLKPDFGTIRFTVDEGQSNFSYFNFKPAAGYSYTEGDEAKLVCMNAGYETYWDAATGTFRLQAK